MSDHLVRDTIIRHVRPPGYRADKDIRKNHPLRFLPANQGRLIKPASPR